MKKKCQVINMLSVLGTYIVTCTHDRHNIFYTYIDTINPIIFGVKDLFSVYMYDFISAANVRDMGRLYAL